MITRCTYIHVYYFAFYIHIETLQPLHKSWYASNLINYYNGYFCCLELWKRATIGRYIAMSAQNIRREILSYFRRPYNTPVFISMKNLYLFLHLTCVFLTIWSPIIRYLSLSAFLVIPVFFTHLSNLISSPQIPHAISYILCALFYLFSYWSYYIIISIFGFTK